MLLPLVLSLQWPHASYRVESKEPTEKWALDEQQSKPTMQNYLIPRAECRALGNSMQWRNKVGRRQWLIHIVLAILEAEIRRIVVSG
jgi:hypothetical protein